MADYSYEIGAALGSMTNVEDLGTNFPPPMGMSVQPFSIIRRSVNGLSYGDGFPSTEWRWDYLSKTMLDALLAYIGASNQSVELYIRTRETDGTYTYYSAVMHRPNVDEDMSWGLSGWRDVTIRFTRMEETP